MKNFITNRFEETQKMGFDLAKTLIGGEVLCLYGNLGSGKTTFMQGLAKGLGIERTIISPTFIVMRTYQLGLKIKDLRLKNLYHVDLYRIETEKDVEGLGLQELLGDKDNIVAIEWPEKIEKHLPKSRINIYFEHLTDDKRQIRIG